MCTRPMHGHTIDRHTIYMSKHQYRHAYFLHLLLLNWCSPYFVDFFTTGTNRYFRNCALPMGIDISFVDCTKIANVENALRPDTKVCGILSS